MKVRTSLGLKICVRIERMQRGIPQQVLNCDKTDLFCKKMPKRSSNAHNITPPPVPVSRVLMTLYKRFEWTGSANLFIPPSNYWKQGIGT
ncbi:hypothetical protein AVEN_24750-1 [Araneus ventricosus]|uniref:Uncharacterized protein n=1 Tax=Araneus ventricosus TaxID=182803 RepID=A0A4Y2P3U0_ARAVE|nr:hypothetical protein AVEN_24750-1 [Araneus ventricosus]